MTKEELAELQEKMGLTPLKLAEALGVEHSTIYRYLNGKLKIPRSVELALETIARTIAETQRSESSETITLVIKSSDSLKTHIKEFGKTVKRLRENKRITQKDFSNDFIKIGESYLSDIENGRKANMSLLSVEKIARRLKIKIEIIFDYRE